MAIESNLWAAQQLDNLTFRRKSGALTEGEAAARVRLSTSSVELTGDIAMVEAAIAEQDRVEAAERSTKRWACVYP